MEYCELRSSFSSYYFLYHKTDGTIQSLSRGHPEVITMDIKYFIKSYRKSN